MKNIIKSFAFFCTLFTLSVSYAADIIPYPVKLVEGNGQFIISESTTIICDKEYTDLSTLYADVISEITGFNLTQKSKSKSTIRIKIDNRSNLGKEAYNMDVTEENVNILSSTPEGAFYALQTLRQIIIPIDNKSAKINAVKIEDYPRFAWRGVMLDVSRTFMPKELVKRYIDLFAQYKINVVHMHLTDDQGWRVEIKQYPLLTKVGSKFDAEHNAMGGYYTQEDLKDIVKYAALRGVTIIPEIEMPGHECAAIAAYPWLRCSGDTAPIHIFEKGPSVHEEIFCAGKPEVYEFIYNVLDEITEIFPSPYIHIGGDEAPKAEWEKCNNCQIMMKNNGLTNEEQLQSLFVKHIGEYLRKKNKILVGWDEIMDGGQLAGDEVLMFWRGWGDIPTRIANEAAKGFKIIASPTSHCYFDYKHETIDSKRVYEFEPIPEGVSQNAAQNYIGVQANFWSHIDKSEHNIDKQLFPRILSLAEVGWSAIETRDWNRFKRGAIKNIGYLKNNFVNCFDDPSLN